MNARIHGSLFRAFLQRLLWIMALMVLLAGSASLAMAIEIELKPGYINGTVSLGDETLSQVSISASGGGNSFSKTFYPSGGSKTVSYTLTVNVPDGTNTFSVRSCYAYYDQNRDRICFPNQSVDVTENQTSTADFKIDNPGFIEGTISVNGGDLNGASIYVYTTTSPSYSYYTSTYASLSGQYRIAVNPGTNLRVYGSASFVGGGSKSLPYEYVNVTAGQVTTVDYSVDAPPPPPPVEYGNISGNIAFTGPLTPRHSLTASGPTYKSLSLNDDGSFSFTDLKTGSYTLYANSYFNNNQTVFTHPYANYDPSRSVQVSAGNTTSVDISAQQAFINGQFALTGSVSLDQVYQARRYIHSVSNTPSYGGSGSSLVNLTDGSYTLVASEGDWRAYITYLQFRDTDPDNYLNQNTNLYDYRKEPFTITGGQTLNLSDSYPTGKVAITAKVIGGTLSNPNASGTCTIRDPDTNATLISYNINAYSQVSNQESGQVNIVGFGGTCILKIYAVVNGSSLYFGEETIEIVPGSDQVIDLGGPVISVNFPEPQFISGNSNLQVEGLVTDDVGVASLTVNGAAATLTLTGNPNDPAEQSFTATVNLQRGPNEIVTIATDTADPPNSGQDKRTVYWDEGPPQVSWTPVDGARQTISQGTDILVEGTADDDAGIATVTVNGTQVALVSTGNPANPNEVGFTTTLTGALGDNFIEVVVTDISDRATSETHKVIMVANQPPVANAGADQTVEATSPDGAEVTLDGLASSDPDGDPLSYLWNGPFGQVSGATPVVSLALGAHLIGLTVSDPDGESHGDQVAVSVVDTTPPELTAPLNQSVEATAPLTPVSFAPVSALDIVDGLVIAQTAELGPFALGTHIITWTATDSHGNAAQASNQLTVVDTTPPAVTAPDDITAEATAPLTDVSLGEAIAVDLVDGNVPATTQDLGPFALGTHTVTWSASDNQGNLGTDTQSVTVVDTTAPALTVPDDVTAYVWRRWNWIDLGTATAVDLVDGELEPVADHTGLFKYGDHTVTWTVTDNQGNTAVDTQSVSVVYCPWVHRQLRHHPRHHEWHKHRDGPSGWWDQKAQLWEQWTQCLKARHRPHDKHKSKRSLRYKLFKK